MIGFLKQAVDDVEVECPVCWKVRRNLVMRRGEVFVGWLKPYKGRYSGCPSNHAWHAISVEWSSAKQISFQVNVFRRIQSLQIPRLVQYQWNPENAGCHRCSVSPYRKKRKFKSHRHQTTFVVPQDSSFQSSFPGTSGVRWQCWPCERTQKEPKFFSWY